MSGFTGIDAPYDVPAAPDLVVATAESSVSVAAERLARYVGDLVALPGLAARAGAD